MGDSSAVGEGRSGAEGTPGSENASSPDLAGSPGGRARVSIVDVAQRAGVSVATVSRALRAMPNVSSATRERVLAAADELQYTASPLAAGLVTGRIRSVGVVTRYAGRWFFAEVVRGIEEALHAGGYDLVLHVVGDPARRAAFFADLPLRRRVDAVLVVGLPLDEQELVVLRGLNVPLACVGEPIPGLHGERIDNVAAARTATQHLINLGHRRIAMIGGSAEESRGNGVPGQRAQGYRAALAAAGLEIRAEWECDGRFTAQGGELAMTNLLSRQGGRPTGVFCQSDEIVFGALRALRRSGLACPGDVSVVGFDDHELAETFDVTTIAQPVAAQGAAAARWLVDQLEGRRPGPGSDVQLHAVRLVLRGSTGPVRDT